MHRDRQGSAVDPQKAGVGGPGTPGARVAGSGRNNRTHAERLQLDGECLDVDAHPQWSPWSFSKFSLKTIRLSSSLTGAPSIFQYSPMKSDHGSSDPKMTRSAPNPPFFSISTSSQRAPKPIAQEVSV